MLRDEIKDHVEFESWLRDQPTEQWRAELPAVTLRAYLRLVPVYFNQMKEEWAHVAKVDAIPMLRCALAGSLAARGISHGTGSEVLEHVSSTRRRSVDTYRELLEARNPSQDERSAIKNGFDSGDAALWGLSSLLTADAVATGEIPNLDSAIGHAIGSLIDYHQSLGTLGGPAISKSDPYRIAILDDLDLARTGARLADDPLWRDRPPEDFQGLSRGMLDIWRRQPDVWGFWLRWWEGALSGNQLDWELQKEIAQIPEAIWQQGPEAMAAAIRQIELHHANLAEPDLIEKALAALPASPREQIAHFKDTVALHQEDIPPTLDALLEYCGREIDRLQGRNAPYSSEEEEEEVQRQIRVLTSIFSTLRKLQETIPSDGAMDDKDAERGERLTRLFVRLIKQWPRKNAEDLVDSVYRAALVGLTATLGPMIGVSAAVATGAGVALFGGKKISDGIKAAKDLGEMASKP